MCKITERQPEDRLRCETRSKPDLFSQKSLVSIATPWPLVALMEGAQAGIHSAQAAKSATSTIPIIFSAGDPVGLGLVASLARPGGNLTGVSTMVPEMTPKRLELLFGLVPHAGVIALLVNPKNPQTERIIRDTH